MSRISTNTARKFGEFEIQTNGLQNIFSQLYALHSGAYYHQYPINESTQNVIYVSKHPLLQKSCKI